MKKWENAEVVELGLDSTKSNICTECGADLDAAAVVELSEEERYWWPHKPGCSHNKPAKPGFGPQGPVTPELAPTVS